MNIISERGRIESQGERETERERREKLRDRPTD